MLADFRVLDLTWVLGGPFAGQLLAQLGAEVIKVEPIEGDLSRRVSSHSTEFDGDSGFFLSVNRGKSSIALDLKKPEGRAVIYDLVRNADAIVYGFAPDVPARLGLDRASLHKINPKLTIAQLIGIHDEAPYADAPAFDLVVQAMAGVMSITGERGGAPVRVGYQVADLVGGLYLALSCVGGMLKSLKTGKGERVQVSLLDCQLAMLTWQAQNYFISGKQPAATGARHPVIAPSDIYPCADGKFIAVSPTGQRFWEQFCAAIGRAELADDPRFKTPKSRVANVGPLTEILNQVFGTRTSVEWGEKLFADRVPAAPVNGVAEAVAQPVAMLRKMVEQLDNPRGLGMLKFLGNPFKYDAGKPLAYPPKRGEQTREILTRVCGYDAAAIDRLIADNVVYQGENNDASQ
jgi:crotonobetainyl-CoA:carnitine CoA-transferase CaiB-like acyl-CoA transferase